MPHPNTPPVHNYAQTYSGIWWYTCRCNTPETHIDAEEITDPLDIEGAHWALDMAGCDVMNRPMLWQIIRAISGYFPEQEEELMRGVEREMRIMERYGDGRMF